MITIKRLKELIKDLPDDAKCFGYEGEYTGITIKTKDNKYMFIGASDSRPNEEDDTYLEGF